MKSPDFGNTFPVGHGSYSHRYNGCNLKSSMLEIWGTDTYGEGITKSFYFSTGDIIELEWNGPLKKFTTTKISTGEKYFVVLQLYQDSCLRSISIKMLRSISG